MKVAPEHPFSNGTEGREWMATWCEWCAEDHACHDPENDFSDGCELILLSLRNKPVAEWTDYSEELGFTLPASMTCSRFAECDCNQMTEYPPLPPPAPGIPRILVGDWNSYGPRVSLVRRVRQCFSRKLATGAPVARAFDPAKADSPSARQTKGNRHE